MIEHLLRIAERIPGELEELERVIQKCSVGTAP